MRRFPPGRVCPAAVTGYMRSSPAVGRLEQDLRWGGGITGNWPFCRMRLQLWSKPLESRQKVLIRFLAQDRLQAPGSSHVIWR